MSALMDQVRESEATSRPHRVAHPRTSAGAGPAHRLEAPLVILASLAVAGGVFGFAMARFGWAGVLFATWPALAMAGGFGCLCQDAFRRLRGALQNPREVAALDHGPRLLDAQGCERERVGLEREGDEPIMLSAQTRAYGRARELRRRAAAIRKYRGSGPQKSA